MINLYKPLSRYSSLCLIFSVMLFIPEKIYSQPNQPTLVYPDNGGDDLTEFPTLEVTVSDDNSANLTVRFYGKEAVQDNTFTLIGLPDTQYYSKSFPQIFNSQTQWIVDQKNNLNIVYVAHVGDLVQNADNTGEWENADHSMSLLEDPDSPSYGIPYGTAIGNHDIDNGSTTMYNNYFGVSRFLGRSYYQDHYGENNNNHCDFFNANGMDFMVIYIEYDNDENFVQTQNVIIWAEDLLQTNSNRRAIIVAHRIIQADGTWREPWGLALYDAFKDNSNVFLMLCGHYNGEAKRTDIYNGNTIYTLLSCYQGSGDTGGEGWLRIMEFDPVSGMINVKTYSPWLLEWEDDSNSDFSLSYDMSNYDLLATDLVINGNNATYLWGGLQGGKSYDWYVTVEDDDGNITEGPIWSFSTNPALPVELSSFTAKVNWKKVILEWSTETEVNNYGFDIERSSTSFRMNWETIGFAEGYGNSNSPKHYSFIDNYIDQSGKYYYRLKQIDNDGTIQYSDKVTVEVGAPNSFYLSQNYPNPFNPETKIDFSIPQKQMVTLRLYNSLGQQVEELVNEVRDAGSYSITFNGAGLPSGIYIYNLKTESLVINKKMTLLK